jgi:hypothetical protein
VPTELSTSKDEEEEEEEEVTLMKTRDPHVAGGEL